MPEWALELLKNNKLSDLDVENIVVKIQSNDAAFSKESSEISENKEDKLRRYNM